MRVAVVIFPGSNCDHDAVHACRHVMGWDVIEVWHESADLGGADLVILPGGFSYGDYLRCGAIARFSPVLDAVIAHANKGGLTLGICNGFQVLIEAGLLPGALLRNVSLEFRCFWTHLAVQTDDSNFTRELTVSDVLRIPIAHGDGNYFAPPDVLAELNTKRRVAFRYCDSQGAITTAANPNGSSENIAGILSEGRNVLGMMPHPERAVEDALGSSHGQRIFSSLAAAHADVGW
jgi:phosphoribosylformylglycinamidine synthase subunit PurQ / glutaminase